MVGEPWRHDEIELLQRLWADGETAQAIAARLGNFSRSAVLGKIFRLRLSAAKKPPAQARRSGEILARRRAGKVAQTEPAKRGRQGKTLHELTNTCCRWPYKRPGAERYFFCGVAEADLEAGIPYCARHMKRAYLVPPPLAVRRPWTAIKPATAEQRHARDWRKRQANELRRVFGGR